MFGTLAMFVVYLVQETSLVTTTAGLGAVLGGAVILTVIASVVMPATGKFKTFSSSKNSSHTSKNKIVQDQRTRDSVPRTIVVSSPNRINRMMLLLERLLEASKSLPTCSMGRSAREKRIGVWCFFVLSVLLLVIS